MDRKYWLALAIFVFATMFLGEAAAQQPVVRAVLFYSAQ